MKRILLAKAQIIEKIRSGNIDNVIEVDFNSGKIYDMDDLSASDFVNDLTNENIMFFEELQEG